MTPVGRELYQTVPELVLQTLQSLFRPLEVTEVAQPQIFQLLHPSEIKETLISDVTITGQMEPLQSVLKQRWYNIKL